MFLSTSFKFDLGSFEYLCNLTRVSYDIYAMGLCHCQTVIYVINEQLQTVQSQIRCKHKMSNSAINDVFKYTVSEKTNFI